MPKPPATTADQLRKLMQSHIEKDAGKPLAIQKPSPVVTTEPVFAEPAIKVPVITPSRYSLRLLPTEIAKINAIVQTTLEQTGERVTLTDVLRVSIGRVGESAPITKQEITLLRATDGRRKIKD